MAGVRAIDTAYSGRLFRSRLEARWAVFFNRLGIRWEYEKEGFELPDESGQSLRYLPDFWIPHIESYVEIKADDPSDSERAKAGILSSVTDKCVYIFSGMAHWGAVGLCVPWGEVFIPEGGWDLCQMWCECWQCGFIGIQFEGRSARLECACKKSGDRDHNSSSKRLVMAYRAALSARFEFGESP